MKKISFTIVLFLNIFVYGQAKEYNIFDSTRVYTYSALFITPKGDTLTKESIVLKPLGIPWEFQKTQIKYNVTYYPTDSVLNLMRSPKLKSKKKWEPVKIFKKTSSGAVEDSLEIWMHPFRSNQYMYTEVCAFPFVKLDNLTIGAKWEGSIIYILSGWGRFKGKVSESYLVESKLSYYFKDERIDDCWGILGVGLHNKLGKSNVRYVFNERYGFLEFNYTCFDGTKIQFKLESIKGLN